MSLEAELAGWHGSQLCQNLNRSQAGLAASEGGAPGKQPCLHYPASWTWEPQCPAPGKAGSFSHSQPSTISKLSNGDIFVLKRGRQADALQEVIDTQKKQGTRSEDNEMYLK